jgi:acetyl esterase/lipase
MLTLGPYGRNGHLLDVYLPQTAHKALPALVYLHGGGLVAGTRTNVPAWNKEPALAAGVAVISPDYSKLPEKTGFDLIDDAQDLLDFLKAVELPNEASIDMSRLAFVGRHAKATWGRFNVPCRVICRLLRGTPDLSVRGSAAESRR